LVKVAHKKWPKNESDLEDEEYELSILKYYANKEALVEHKKGTPMEEGGTLVEEEEEPKTPSQLASEEGKDEDNMDEKCCGSNNHVIVESQHQEECWSPLYVHYRMHTSK